MIYTLRLYMSKYMKVSEDKDYETVEVSRMFSFRDYEDVMNFIGYLTEGADGWVKFELEAVKEEE